MSPSAARRPDVHAVHSVNQFVFSVPDLNEARRFYTAFGLDVRDEGCGAEQMRTAGFSHGWGVGRHVLGSNYFYYVQDPWGSWAEYSFDIDFIGHDLDWPAADHPPEDSLYVWGPGLPDDFITNRELA